MGSSRDRPWGWWVGSLAVGAVLVILVARPLWELLAIGVEQLDVRGPEALDRAVSGSALFNTLWTGAAIALISVALGTGAAFVTERLAVAGRRWLRIGILLPILVPGFVSALSWARAYGPRGLSDRLVGVAFPGLFGPVGVVAVVAVNAAPIAYLIAVAALTSRAEPDLERAALVHGAGWMAGMRTVTLPLLAPVLAGAGALTFIGGINAFGVPAILGTPTGFATVTTRIYQDLAFSARPEAFARAVLLAVLLVLIALFFVVLAERLLAGIGMVVRSGGPQGPVASPGKAGVAGAVVIWTFVAVTTILPLLVLVLVALTRAVGLPPVPAHWTVAHFAEALNPRYLGPLGRSLLLAILAAVLAMVLGGAVVGLRRRRSGRFFSGAVLLSFAIPGSTLAVAVLLSYGQALRDTLALILIAYLAKLWGVGHRAVEGVAVNVAPETYWASRASGASGLTALGTVVEPQLRRGVLAGGILVFLFAFHELTMSSLLYGPGSDTLAVVILNLQQLGDVPVSSALAVILTLPLLVVAAGILVFRRPPVEGG